VIYVFTRLYLVPGNIHDMRLPAGQIEKMNKLSSLGKPIVTILVEGRPRVLGNIPECSNALIQSYLPGPWGGIAIGNVLFGNSNPSGRLPYTYPKNAGDLNLNYWRPISDVWDPLYEFGHGLSYSHFTYGNITLNGKNNDELDSNDKARKLYANERETEIEVAITNDSPIDGKETVLMYVEQPVRRVTPFAKLLKDFSKVFIPAGQTVKVKFGVKADMFKYTGIDDVPGNSLDDGPIRILIGDQIFHLNISST
jgi:beta-glucosidase